MHPDLGESTYKDSRPIAVGTPSYDRNLDPDKLQSQIRDKCPGCDDPDPKIRSMAKGGSGTIVECQTCGYSPDPTHSPIRYEEFLRAVYRWNKEVTL